MKTEQLLKEATARPWINTEWSCHAPITIKGGSKLVADLAALGRSSDECLPDAALIVRAVNSFEAMREALKFVCENDLHLSFSCANEGKHNDQCRKCVATKAIAIAEGKETK